MRTAGTSADRVLRATIEYDGSRYRGWQAQMNARTVQGEVIRAALQVFGDGIKVHGAGRTDAGVHAFGQVASIHLPAGRPSAPVETFRRSLNDLLPPDINILRLTAAPPSFHARLDAVLRVYRYRIARRRTAFGKPFVFWVKDPLDVEAMKAAGELLRGRHDFGSFCENPEGHTSTLVEVSFVTVEVAPEEPDLLLLRFGASHYLWKMIRRVVGVLLEVGHGRLSGADLAGMLATRSPEPARLTVPPSGLFLESVVYPGEQVPPPVPALRPAF